jgi:hypothetical protein
VNEFFHALKEAVALNFDVNGIVLGILGVRGLHNFLNFDLCRMSLARI